MRNVPRPTHLSKRPGRYYASVLFWCQICLHLCHQSFVVWLLIMLRYRHMCSSWCPILRARGGGFLVYKVCMLLQWNPEASGSFSQSPYLSTYGFSSPDSYLLPSSLPCIAGTPAAPAPSTGRREGPRRGRRGPGRTPSRSPRTRNRRVFPPPTERKAGAGRGGPGRTPAWNGHSCGFRA